MTDNVAVPTAPPIHFCVIVNCPLQRAVLHSQALNFCRALAHSTHTLLGVFFYGDAVSIMDAEQAAELRGEWCDLLTGANVDGVICAAAASRRNLANQQGVPNLPLPPPLRLGGLGEWVSWSVRAQRVVRFA